MQKSIDNINKVQFDEPTQQKIDCLEKWKEFINHWREFQSIYNIKNSDISPLKPNEAPIEGQELAIPDITESENISSNPQTVKEKSSDKDFSVVSATNMTDN